MKRKITLFPLNTNFIQYLKKNLLIFVCGQKEELLKDCRIC